MCAGVTTFNALRNSGARGGDMVAVLGLAGSVILACKFAAWMGFNTVAIARGKDKEAFAKKLGAHHYIDSQASDPAAELNKLGGAKVVIATVTNAEAMAAVLGGLAPNGVLMVIGAAGPLSGRSEFCSSWVSRSVKGLYSGTPSFEYTLEFSTSSDVHSMNEIFHWKKLPRLTERMMSGKGPAFGSFSIWRENKPRLCKDEPARKLPAFCKQQQNKANECVCIWIHVPSLSLGKY